MTTKEQQAKGKLMLAISRLAAIQPFLGGILSSWHIEPGPVDTMSVGFRHARLTLVFSPDFVDKLASVDFVAAVVAHEAAHVIAEHVLHVSTRDENRAARIVATETVANDFVPPSLPLPGKPIVTADYSMLDAAMGTDERYSILRDVVTGSPLTLDNHVVWDELIKTPNLAVPILRRIVGKAWDSLSKEQKEKLPTTMRNIVLASARQSTASSCSVGSGKAHVPWQRVLRRYVGRTLNRTSVLNRPPRRYPELIGILPCRSRTASSKPTVLACVDTSGSVSRKNLADISAELAVMARTYEVVVVEFDCRVRRTHKYRPIKDVYGRTGTDFRVLFADDILRRNRCDLMCIFTDGQGPAPAHPPHNARVIWALVANGDPPVPWGKVVRIQG